MVKYEKVNIDQKVNIDYNASVQRTSVLKDAKRRKDGNALGQECVTRSKL